MTRQASAPLSLDMADIATVIPAPLATSLFGWWHDMGVETLVDETPVAWLDRGRPPGRAAPQGTEPAEIRMPSTHPVFVRWLLESPDIPEAGPPARRIAASGDPLSDLMVMVDMPEPGDAEAGLLLTGEAGALFDKMLAALKRNRDSVYLAALCPGRAPTGMIPPSSLDALAAMARRHIGLTGAKQLWLMGSAVSRAILGMEMAAARGTLHKFNHDHGSVDVVASFSPRFLLQSPRRKADAWADMQLLIGGSAG